MQILSGKTLEQLGPAGLTHWVRVQDTRHPWARRETLDNLRGWIREAENGDKLAEAGEKVMPLLLSGETRCGKTSTLCWLARSYFEVETYRASIGSMIGSLMGETVKNFGKAIAEACNGPPGLYLMDEADGIFQARIRDGGGGGAVQEVMDCQLKQAALSLSGEPMLNARNDRRHYGRPSCDVDRADVVGMVDEVARLASKLGLAFAVGLVDVAARGTSPRGVARIHDHEFDASEDGLVGEEAAQLKERPSRVHRSLASPDRCPLADARQVFDGDTTPGAFGLGDDVLRDHVVGMCSEAGLLARESFEVAPGRLGAGGLKSVAKPLVALARILDGRAAVGLAIGVDCQIPDAQINSKPTLGVDGRTIGNLDGDVEKPLALAQDEVGLAAHAFQAGTMVWASDVGQEDAARDGEQGHTVQRLETQDALVVGDGSARLEGGLAGAIPLVGFNHLGNSPYRHLRGQPKLLTQLAVMQSMQPVLVGGLQLESAFRKPVAGRVHTLKRSQQGVSLLGRGKQLRGGYEFHCLEDSLPSQRSQLRTGRRFLRRLKATVSTPGDTP